MSGAKAAHWYTAALLLGSTVVSFCMTGAANAGGHGGTASAPPNPPCCRAGDDRASEPGKPAAASSSPVATDAGSSSSTSAGGTSPNARQQGPVLPSDSKIVVGDRTLTGPFSSLEQRGNRIFLPVTNIARTLGDAVRVNPIARTVEVQRQTGVTAEFDAPLNLVRENGAVILSLSGTSDIVFSPDPEGLMLPIEVVAALLDVSVIIDAASYVVRVSRGGPNSPSARAGTQHSPWELYRVDYQYNLNGYSTDFAHTLALNSSGRIGDGRFTWLSNIDAGTNRDAITLRRTTFTYERPNGQRFIGGDFGTGTDLTFMSAALRGVWLQQPVGALRVTSFAGRALSGFLPLSVIEQPQQPGLQRDPGRFTGSHYDTNTFGAYASFGPSLSNASLSQSLLVSSGVMYFDGPHSRGEIATGSVKYTSVRNRFVGDFGAGSFDGIGSDGTSVRGFAPMVDLSEFFTLRDNLSLQGRFVHIGRNFLDPQSSGINVARNLFSGGVNWRPISWISSSINGSSSTRLDQSGQTDRSITATVSVTPRGPLPMIMFTHTKSSGTLLGNSAYTLINATRELNRWRLFGNFSRIRIGSHGILPGVFGGIQNPPSITATAGALVRLDDSNTLQFSQTIGNGGSYGGAIDWSTSSFFSKRVNLGAGFSYNRSGTTLTTTERLVAVIQLPHEHVLQFAWNQTPNGPQILMQIRGLIFASPRAEAAATSSLSEINSYGAFYGRVYQDVDLNGRYDPGADRPQADVRVRVDGAYYAVSDKNGLFRIENIKEGEHNIYLDLLSVRADLTILGSPQFTTSLIRGRDSIIDFRLVRTGRMRGTVWIDKNGNGVFDDGEQPLPDVRVVTGSGRDTLTDSQGDFILGDLPPGEHVVLIDEKTLPENLKSALGPLRITVKAGAETPSVDFPIVTRPPAVNIKRFP
jgi:hypothetical protein